MSRYVLLVFLFNIFLTLPMVSNAASQISLLNKNNERIQGQLNNIENGRIRINSKGFPLKISLDSLQVIQLDDLEKPVSPRGRNILVLRNETTRAYRRILSGGNNNVKLELANGKTRDIPYEQIHSIHIGKGVEHFSIVFRNDREGTRTINYRPGSTGRYSTPDRIWTVRRRGDYYVCSGMGENENARDTSFLRLWSLPPKPGASWNIHPINGTGKWLSDTNTISKSGPSHDLYSFSLDFPSDTGTVSFRGQFSSTLLLPTEFTIHAEESTRWTLDQWPQAVRIQPCALYPFIREAFDEKEESR